MMMMMIPNKIFYLFSETFWLILSSLVAKALVKVVKQKENEKNHDNDAH